MRRIRKNLITKGPKPRADAPIEEALAAREANILGKNGVSHAQDRYLARANEGDLVVPLDELSPETRAKLEQAVGGFEGKIAGQGGEIDLSDAFTNGVGVAEENDAAAIRDLLSDSKGFGDHIEHSDLLSFVTRYLTHRPDFQSFVHKTDGTIDGVVFVGLFEDIVPGKRVAILRGPFAVGGQTQNYDSLSKAAKVWAETKEADLMQLHTLV